MKKFLVLALVLGMTSMASAVIQLSVNGLPAPDEIVLAPSDTIVIDIMVMDGHNVAVFDWGLNLSNDLGKLDAADITFHQFDLAGKVLEGNAQRLRMGGGNIFSPAVEGPAKIVDEILFHCEGEGDVIVDLVIVDQAGNIIDGESNLQDGHILDRLIIRQIPEPMTMALLGLGGLALIRRRRA